MELIVTTGEELCRMIRAEVDRALNTKSQPQQIPDRCTFDDALEITGLSKSKLYKLTSSKKIPNKRFGNRLIFSREELLEWVKVHTVDKSDESKACLELAKSARNKSRRG